MTTFYICRHGQTENNKAERLSGWIDTPLTDQGIENTISTAAKLRDVRLDQIISSDIGRAFITAYLVGQRLDASIAIEWSKQLREINYGDLSNMPISSYPKKTPLENANYAPLNGESLIQMQQRVLAYVAQLSANNPDQTILLVGHDGTINAIKANFEGKNIGLVDAESHNGYDFVAKFTYDENTIEAFEEITI